MNRINSISEDWYVIRNADELYSPALIVFPDRIEENISIMISVAGDAGRLRPHVKTHKMAEIVSLQMKHGIKKFKCSTIAEAEMCAMCGADDILLACQPVGPNIGRFFRLLEKFPGIKISCITDNAEIVQHISGLAGSRNRKVSLWLDINSGMNRTGIIPGKEAAGLYRMIASSPVLVGEGLHVYDGHIHHSDLETRRIACDNSFSLVEELVKEVSPDGINPLKIVAGGTPTFPLHARRKGTELSPGTTLLWDHGYASSFPDMHFLNAALLIMRVISKPSDGLLCLDLGHKALASEMPQPRVKLIGLKEYEIVGHNEEHMVIKTSESAKFNTGDLLYGIPQHICPTVDRYDSVYVARNGLVHEEWKVAARRRRITI